MFDRTLNTPLLIIFWLLNIKGVRNLSQEGYFESRDVVAHLQRCSYEKVFWKYAANLQAETHAEVWFE